MTSATPGEQAEGRDPIPPAAGIGAVDHGNALHQRAKGHALGKGCNQRAAAEGPVPEELAAFGAPAELKGHAAQDKGQQHGDERGIEGGQHHGIGQREHGQQTAAAEHQPGFIAIPDGGDGIHHHVAVMAFLGKRKEDADAEIEAVEDHIGENREGDEAGPDEWKIDCHHALLFTGLEGGTGRDAGGVAWALYLGINTVRRFSAEAEDVKRPCPEDEEIDDDEGHQ